MDAHSRREYQLILLGALRGVATASGRLFRYEGDEETGGVEIPFLPSGSIQPCCRMVPGEVPRSSSGAGTLSAKKEH
jgi:hypothetical protein